MGIFLGTLKIAAIILGVVLLFCILILLLLLFWPIVFQLFLEKKDSVEGVFSFQYLGKLVEGQKEFGDGDRFYFRILWFRPFAEDRTKEAEEETVLTSAERPPTPKQDVYKLEKNEIKRNIEQKGQASQIKKEECNQTKKEMENKTARIRRVSMESIPEENIPLKNSVPQKEQKLEELNADYFIRMPLKKKKRLLTHTVRLIKSVLHQIRPRHLKANFTVGFDDPSLTGEVLGLGAILYGLSNENIVIQGDFYNTGIQGTCLIKGRVTIGGILISMLRYAVTKEVRDIILLYLKGNGEKDGK